MSTVIQRPCVVAGCGGFAVPGSRSCARHTPLDLSRRSSERAQADAQRGTAHARGYDARWAAVSRLMRSRFPISPGYLTRTAYWTPGLAAQFHALRTLAAERSEFSAFFQKTGAGTRWLEQFPIYAFHASRAEPAEVTDHIIPHRGDPALFWAEWNLQALSKRQHDTKTATEDGGFRGARQAPPAAPAAAKPPGDYCA